MIGENMEVVMFSHHQPDGRWSKVSYFYIVVRIFTDRITGRKWAFQDLRPFYVDED